MGGGTRENIGSGVYGHHYAGYAWSGACRASPFRILIYSSGIRKMTVPLGDRKINSKTDKVVAVIRKYPLII